jgi:hypothetical protein
LSVTTMPVQRNIMPPSAHMDAGRPSRRCTRRSRKWGNFATGSADSTWSSGCNADRGACRVEDRNTVPWPDHNIISVGIRELPYRSREKIADGI